MFRLALSILCAWCALAACACSTVTSVGPNGETVVRHDGRDARGLAKTVANDAGRNNTNSRALENGATVVEYDDQGRITKMQYDPEARATGPNQIGGGYSGGYARFGTGTGPWGNNLRGPEPQTGWIKNGHHMSVLLMVNGRPYGTMRPSEIRVITVQPGSNVFQAQDCQSNAVIWERVMHIDEQHGDSAMYPNAKLRRYDWNVCIGRND